MDHDTAEWQSAQLLPFDSFFILLCIVSETNIIKELLVKTDISEDQIESVQEAIQTAFKRHQAATTTIFEVSGLVFFLFT